MALRRGVTLLRRRAWRWLASVALAFPLTGLAAADPVEILSAKALSEPPIVRFEAPRVRSMLEHAWGAESGIGQTPNVHLAAYLYCQAARSGSAEGHFRAGQALAAEADPDAQASAAFFLATAAQLGHARAMEALERLVQRSGPSKSVMPSCLNGAPYEARVAVNEERDRSAATARHATIGSGHALFDIEAYVAALRPERRRIAQLVAKLAPDFGIDMRLALAIASVESNFDPRATSPKNARGVMQLIPDTAKRFNVLNPYDAVECIKGGLAYLRWLSDYFAGDMLRVVAAYNAGEGAVMRYQGVPPYEETRMYVRRVIELTGLQM